MASAHPPGMDDARFGSAVRAVRIRQRLTQDAVARRAGVGTTTVSSIERGHLEGLTIRTLRHVLRALGMSPSLDVRWRGSDLERLMDEAHALLVREVVTRLTSLGWEVRPEHSFNVRGERGSIDVFARHAPSSAVLAVEVKSRIVDLQDLLSVLDRKRRLLPKLAGELGWECRHQGTVLVLPDRTAVRSSVERFDQVFSSSLPAGTRAVTQWMAFPGRSISGIWFVRFHAGTGVPSRGVGATRVRQLPGASFHPGLSVRRDESSP
jgi:transcriptional regulator with XRE-family HTH domain